MAGHVLVTGTATQELKGSWHGPQTMPLIIRILCKDATVLVIKGRLRETTKVLKQFALPCHVSQ